jgi:VRR-NUC domain
MRRTEDMALDEFKAEFKDEGWESIRGGWPDFMLIRSNDGKLEVMCLEAKSGKDTLRPHQIAVHTALAAAGIKTVVRTV